jgi:hypothetical protein
MHSKALIQHLVGINFKESVGHVFVSKKNLYSPYGPAQKSSSILL